MKHSARAQRKARHYKRRRSIAGLNLTALMDIFTILVFFLLVNQTNSQQLPDNPDIVLPESIAQEVPNEVLTLQISPVAILLQDRPLISVADALAGETREIAVLVNELNTFAARAGQLTGPAEDGRELMIMADRQVSYALLQRVMHSANQTEYTRLAFAVLRTAGEDAE